ncbi:hypothetical protein CBA19CS91_05935 [Paraburkholderia hospita]|jgi:hypothetical protein|nr:hypothetical protein CBA19CS91_05935 [Paraburkholderia hospita]
MKHEAMTRTPPQKQNQKQKQNQNLARHSALERAPRQRV